ncbi:hypothetical protein O3P69_000817 [Scylla paramamosain]|uniref:Uncharacterized protein n=1 Tax=Scylla paramamosain TaxID=85552 RepID=A0AAW0USL5_SCYPA
MLVGEALIGKMVSTEYETVYTSRRALGGLKGGCTAPQFKIPYLYNNPPQDIFISGNVARNSFHRQRLTECSSQSVLPPRLL